MQSKQVVSQNKPDQHENWGFCKAWSALLYLVKNGKEMNKEL